MMMHILALLCCSVCLLGAQELDIFGEPIAEGDGVSLAEQESIYQELFGAQDKRATSSSKKLALAQILYGRMEEADFAAIKPYLRRRITELLDGNKNAEGIQLSIEILLDEIAESEPPYRIGLHKRHANLLATLSGKAPRDERSVVIAELASVWNAMAMHAWTQGDLVFAEEAYGELESILKKRGDREGSALAGRLEKYLGAQRKDLEELVDEADADRRAEAYLLMNRADLAAAAGGSNSAAKLAGVFHDAQRWGQPTLPGGFAKYDLTLLRAYADGGGRQRCCDVLSRLVDDANVGPVATGLREDLRDTDIAWGTVRNDVLAFADTVQKLLKTNGKKQAPSDADILAAIDACKDMLGDRLKDDEEAAVLQTGLSLLDIVAKHEEEVSAIIPLKLKMARDAWEPALAAVADSLPTPISVSAGGIDEDLLLRKGWERLFNHKKIPFANKQYCSIDEGDLLIGCPRKAAFTRRQFNMRNYEEVIIRIDTTGMPDMKRNPRWHIKWGNLKNGFGMLSRGIGEVDASAAYAKEFGSKRIREGVLELHFRADAAKKSISGSINGSEFEPFVGRQFGVMYITVSGYGKAKEDSVLRVMSALGKPKAK